MNSVLVLAILINYFGNVTTFPIPAQPVKLLSDTTIVIFLRKKMYKKLSELEDKIEATELKIKRKLLYLKTKLEPPQPSTFNVSKHN